MTERMCPAERAFWDALSASPNEVPNHRDDFFRRHGRSSFNDCTAAELAAYYTELRALVRQIASRRFGAARA